MRFWWWDDALTWAVSLSAETKLRHRVERDGEAWRVTLAPSTPRLHLLEVCS